MTESDKRQRPPERGKDTPTGTDPDARYEEPGYHDKSLGQAVDQDQDLVEDLMEETGGDVDEAEEEFEERSTGAPARERQTHDDEGGRDDHREG